MKTARLPLGDLVSLKGKTAVITGGASGIGFTIAERYAEAGAALMLVDVNGEKLVSAQTKLAEGYGANITTYTVDLTDRTAVRSLWGSLSGPVDILVNNAGIYPSSPFVEATDEFIDKVLDINLRAVVTMCQEMIRRRTARGCTIVNISSIEARTALKEGMAFYGISKAGVEALTRSIAKEYANDGVKVNCILPGGVATDGAKAMVLNDALHLKFDLLKGSGKFKDRLPIGRIAEPDDIARVALFLALPLSDYMAGTSVVVDGGFLAA